MKIVIFAFDGMTALDAVGPYDVFARMPGANIEIAGLERRIVRTEQGPLGLSVEATLDQVAHADLLLIPGGFGTRALLREERVLSWIAALDRGTRITASVCTGALLLGAAGLLRGRRANTHWGVRERLREFGAEPSAERVVRDGKYATSAGVSAGIDLALTLVQELAGRQVAEAIVLGLEYDPAPPISFAAVSADVRAALASAIAEREAKHSAR
jgi:putative intracellular protease/amidase